MFARFLQSTPENARKFSNGDFSIKRDEYVKGQPMFAYYKPTQDGFELEKTLWKGVHVQRYNWVKLNDPSFKSPVGVPEQIAPEKAAAPKMATVLRFPGKMK